MFLLPLQFHQATIQDQDWVNKHYQQVNFRPSDLSQDYVGIASWMNEPAGLGRLQPIDNHSWELGGMYVFEAFRKKGIAGRMVQHLLQQAPQGTTIYCLPFELLAVFYKRYGFEELPAEEWSKVPEYIREKINWCNRTYPDAVLLLAQRR
ncbi:MAG: GNAT family N-acetyltransferase [Bacteroidota bacterium]